MMDEHDFNAKITDAALGLAAELGWGRVTLSRIAEAADIPFDQFYGRCAAKTDVLDLIAQRFDRAAVGEFELEPEASLRERAFDAAMARFDAMEPHRAGLTAIYQRSLRDPAIAARAWRWNVRTARWLLEMAEIDTAGLAGAARVRLFAVILGRTGRVWLDDEAGDQARTMASLDRQLRDVSEFAKTWKGRWSRATSFRRRPRDADPEGPPPINPEGRGAEAESPS